MSEPLKHSELLTPFVDDDRWALVKRIAGSRQFLKAPQLREILFYVARRALIDNAAAITEQEIGCKVLGRRPDFNPNEDNIVRAQVRHLRRKLDEYFASEGAAEALVLTIPKGGYLPRFEPRLPAPQSRPAEQPTARKPAWRSTALVWLALIALAILLLGVLKERESRRTTPARADFFWSRIFPAGGETNIVVSDSNLVAVQDILDTDVRLTDYLSGYPEKTIQAISDPKLQAALQLISSRQYTSLGDANIASRLLDLGRRRGARTAIRYARFCSVREFKSGNFVLIGSRRGIPWEQLFEPQLNFQLEEDRTARSFHLRNKKPLPGEPDLYGPSTGADQETYADIALLPNLCATGSVLILSGLDMAATEAAGELVTNADFPAVLARVLKIASGRPLPSRIEFLVEAKAVAGTAENPKIVAWRVSR